MDLGPNTNLKKKKKKIFFGDRKCIDFQNSQQYKIDILETISLESKP